LKYHLISLGCPKNTFDSEEVCRFLKNADWLWVQDPLAADLVMLNTCGFIREAKEESLGKIMELVELKKRNPNLKIVAFGCLVKRYSKEIKKGFPELDFSFDFPTRNVLEFLNEKFGPQRKETPKENSKIGRILTPSHYGYLKIADGCDNRCSYCAIPEIKGPFISRDFDQVLKDAQMLEKSGAKEIIIVSQDTLNYGAEKTGKSQLPELVKEIGKLKGVVWIRLQYLHPKRIEFSLLDRVFSQKKVLPYFDIPLQHVSDRVLNLMHRMIDKKRIIEIWKYIRKNFSPSIIRSTFIVGFPSETEKEFQELLDFIEDFPIDRLGAFSFSSEEGTPATRLKPQFSARKINRRLDELMSFQQLLSYRRNQELIGSEMEVIVDEIVAGEGIGRSFGDSPEIDNRVLVKNGKNLSVGEIVKVRILAASSYDFEAERTV